MILGSGDRDMSQLIIGIAASGGALAAMWDSVRTLRTAFAWDQHVDDAMRVADFDRWEREHARWKASL
jgi:hypothetical protein